MVTIQPQRVALTRELPGRTSAFRVAEVRARVNGIVLKRLFQEGSDVRAGQPLFQIDAAPYQAALDSAKAQLARAEASVARPSSRPSATRSWWLNAVSQQEHDDALAARRREADVAAGAPRCRPPASTSPTPGDRPRLRAHRQLGGHRGRLRPGRPGHAAGHGPAARPDLRGRDPVGGGAAAAPPRRWRAASCTRRGPEGAPRSRCCWRTARTYRRRQAAVLRRHRRPEHRLHLAARRVPQPEGRAAARHVRARAARRGRRRAGHPGAAARGNRDATGKAAALVVDARGQGGAAPAQVDRGHRRHSGW